MNRTYRLKWNDNLRGWIPVGENAKTRVGRAGARALRRLGTIAVAGVLLALPLVAQAKSAADVAANALPTGFELRAGSADLPVTAGNEMTIKQHSKRVVYGWNGFDVGSTASVVFDQKVGDMALNIIGGSDPSYIIGALKATGTVFFYNPNGMFFGNGASINVGGLLATTMKMDPDGFMNGTYRLTEPGSGKIRNEAIIDATGSVALIGNTVENVGKIYATTVTLAAGNNVAIDMTGDGLIRARVEAPALKASILNSGTIKAVAAVTLTAGQARDTLDRVVNNTGTIRATGLVERGGEIVLEGGSITNSGTLAVGPGGSITATADENLTIAAGSSLTADDGQITLTAGKVANVEKGASIRADRGRIKLWSDLDTFANGSFRARNGFIETSGKYLDTWGIGIDAAGGTWLLDPTDITIAHGSGSACNPSGGICAVSGSTSTINDADLSSILSAGTNVIIDTASAGTGSGNITFASNAAIAKTGGGDADLTLYADQSIVLNGSITSTSGHLNVSLNAGRNGSTGTNSTNGNIGTQWGYTIDTNGGSFVASGDTIKLINGSISTGGGDISLTALAQSAASNASSLRISDIVSPFPTTLDSGGGNISMTSAGNIDINGTVNAGTGNITLTLNGASSSTATTYGYAAVTTAGLELLGGANANYTIGASSGNGGNSVLAPGATKSGNSTLPPSAPMKVAGNFNTLSLYVGNSQTIGDWVPYATDIVVGTVNGTSGINATGAVSLTASGGKISQTAPIATSNLTANASTWYNGATVDLSNALNQIAAITSGVAGAGSSFAFSGPSFKVVNNGAITINGLVSGGYGGVWIETTNGDVTIGSSGQIKSMLGGSAGNVANSIVVVAGSTTAANFINNNSYGLSSGTNGTALVAQNSYARFLVYAKDVTTSQLYTGAYSPLHGANGREMETYYGTSFYNTWSSGGVGVPTTSSGVYNPYGSAVIFKNQPTATVTPDAVSRTYGDANPSFTYTTSGLTQWDTAYASSVGISGSLSTAATTATGAGNYAIQGTFTSSTGYVVNVAPNTSLTIDPRPISVTADAASKTAGTSDPAFTYQVTSGSLVNGDTVDLTRTAGETAGAYPITLGSNPNYDIAYTGNALTITGSQGGGAIVAIDEVIPDVPSNSGSGSDTTTEQRDNAVTETAKVVVAVVSEGKTEDSANDAKSFGGALAGVSAAGETPVVAKPGDDAVGPPPKAKGRMLVCRKG